MYVCMYVCIYLFIYLLTQLVMTSYVDQGRSYKPVYFIYLFIYVTVD